MVRAMALGVSIVLMHSTFAGELSAKPLQWKKSEGGNNHFYEAVLVPDGINWTEAHLAVTARGCGWHLATITSAEEDEFVFGLIANNDDFFEKEDTFHGPWLGGFQRNAFDEPSGEWRWITSEEFEFTNWGDGEPTNTFGGPFGIAPGIPEGNTEDLLIYSRSNFGEGDLPSWNDFPGNALVPGYIAELEIPRPKFCSRSGS